MAMNLRIWRNNQFTAWQPNAWDIVALLLIFTLFALLAWGAMQMAAPYSIGHTKAISLSISALPGYALRTILRMAVALICSLLFTFVFGYIAARNKHAERILIPLVDILQSVPILGFQAISVIGFILLFPNSMLGPECAAIFAIFTSQAWNMFLGFYQSLKTVPYDLREAGVMYHLSAWQRFWRIEVPFAMPSLIWNMMMSLSAGWFFVVAAEAITVHGQQVLLPGIGSYIAVAILNTNTHAILYAVVAMLAIILLYDQILFRPLIAWSEKFKFEASDTVRRSKPLLSSLLKRTRLLYYVGEYIDILLNEIVNFRLFRQAKTVDHSTLKKSRSTTIFIYLWYIAISLVGLGTIAFLLKFISQSISGHELLHVLLLGSYTSIRVIILIILCSLFWVPIGVWIGLRPRVTHIVQPITQFLAAFPANLLFPAVVFFIVRYQLNVNIWTTPLMILGTQWYILFNVIAGASALPKDLVNVTKNFEVKGWLWWRKFIFPGIFPYFITGAITAAGGAWNASIIAEFVNAGHTKLIASGLGAYITQATNSGDFPRIALGISVMCLYVLIFNRLVWQPLYNLAEKRFQID